MKQNKRLLFNTLKELIRNVMDILPHNNEMIPKFQTYLDAMTNFKEYVMDTVYEQFSEALKDTTIRNAISQRDMEYFTTLHIQGVMNEIKEIQNAMLEYLDQDSQKIVWEYIDLMVEYTLEVK